MTHFYSGQKVRIKESAQRPDSDFNNKVFLVDKVITVDGTQTSLFVIYDGNSFNFEAHRMEPVPARTEGEVIDVNHIKVGDTIRVTSEDGDITHAREAVVGEISFDSWINKTVIRAKDRGRIDFSNTHNETYTLVKAGDETLDLLKSLKVGQVFQYGENSRLVRKRSDDTFTVYFPSGQATVDLGHARSYVGNDEIILLNAA